MIQTKTKNKTKQTNKQTIEQKYRQKNTGEIRSLKTNKYRQ